MIKILAVVPNVKDGTSFYRGAIPLNYLERDYGNVSIDYLDKREDHGWWDLTKYHIVFMQRPCDSWSLNLATTVKALNIKLWLDYDDNIFELNEDNPVKDVYDSIGAGENVANLLALADAVSVSTNRLKEIYHNFNKRIHTIPNAVNDYVFNQAPVWEGNWEGKENISWRGGANHEEDLRSFDPYITEFWKNNQSYRFNFYGHKHYNVLTNVTSKHVSFSNDIFSYLNTLATDSSSIAIVPMNDNSFNRCKSNCAWLEHTYAGSVVLAPDWEEWNKPGVVNYKDKEDFVEKLNSMKDMDLQENLNLSWSYIQNNLRLSKVNEFRYQLIMRLSQ